MTTRLVLLAPVLAVPLLAPLAQAAPTGGLQQAATATVDVTPEHGKPFQLNLEATLPTAASNAVPTLRVTVVADGTSTDYRTALAPGAFTMGNGRAELTTKLGSLPVKVVWVENHYSVAVNAAQATAGTGALAQLRLGTARCEDGTAIMGNAVTQDASQTAASTATALQGVSTRGLSCKEPAHTSLPPAP